MLQATKVKERRHSFRIVFRTSDTFCVTPPLPTHYDILMLKVDLSPDSFSEQERISLERSRRLQRALMLQLKQSVPARVETLLATRQ